MSNDSLFVNSQLQVKDNSKLLFFDDLPFELFQTITFVIASEKYTQKSVIMNTLQ